MAKAQMIPMRWNMAAASPFVRCYAVWGRVVPEGSAAARFGGGGGAFGEEGAVGGGRAGGVGADEEAIVGAFVEDLAEGGPESAERAGEEDHTESSARRVGTKAASCDSVRALPRRMRIQREMDSTIRMATSEMKKRVMPAFR